MIRLTKHPKTGQVSVRIDAKAIPVDDLNIQIIHGTDVSEFTLKFAALVRSGILEYKPTHTLADVTTFQSELTDALSTGRKEKENAVKRRPSRK